MRWEWKSVDRKRSTIRYVGQPLWSTTFDICGTEISCWGLEGSKQLPVTIRGAKPSVTRHHGERIATSELGQGGHHGVRTVTWRNIDHIRGTMKVTTSAMSASLVLVEFSMLDSKL